MGIRLVTLGPEHLPAVMAFSEKTWDRPRGVEFLRWRYLEAPSHHTLLAMRDDECLAILSVFASPYRVGAESATWLETADWFCVPELKTSGLGVRLMRAVMEEPHPIVAVGGSLDTVQLLPRFGWKCIDHASRFVRWLGGGRLGAGLAGAWARWRAPAPAGGAALVNDGVEGLEAELLQLYAEKAECGTVRMPVPERLAWIARGIAGRRLAFICFRIDGRLRAWSLVRLDTTCPAREALLVELFAPADEASLYPWMVAETLSLAASAGCLRVMARTSCPNLKVALRRSWFREGPTIPIHFWSTRASLPPGPFHLGLHTSDFPLRPYPAADDSWGRIGP